MDSSEDILSHASTHFVPKPTGRGTYWFWCGSCLHWRRAGLGGSVGCAVRLETRRSRVQPPSRSATFFRGDWSWNIFYGHSLPSADSRRAVVSFWRKNVHNTVNRLEDYACPVNVWLGKLTTLDMTPLGWLGRKTSTQTLASMWHFLVCTIVGFLTKFSWI